MHRWKKFIPAWLLPALVTVALDSGCKTAADRDGNESSAPNRFTMAVSVIGAGNVQSAPNGIACGHDCSEAFADGTRITLSATPENGYTFSGWSGSGVDCVG